MASIVSAGTTSSTALNMSADTSGVLQLASNNGTTAVTIGTDQSVTFAGSINAPNSFGFKNRIINGAMVIDQRNAGASVSTSSGTFTYAVDRSKIYYTQTSKYTVQQNAGSVTPPSGFINYLGATSSSAFSVGSTDRFMLGYPIEGLNVADLGWGAAGASTITISFWVRSSLTGTFGGAIGNEAGDRSYAFTYTISSANTWEYETITIAGDTSGTWPKNTSGGLYLYFSIGAGSSVSTTAGSWQSGFYVSATGATSVVGTNGATFYITGVQLEKGSTATSFDYRPYSAELQLCQRYFLKNSNDGSTGTFLVGVVNTSTSADRCGMAFPVTMRSPPSATVGGSSNPRIYDAGATPAITSIGSNASSSFGACLGLTASAGALTVGRAAIIIENGTSFITYSAEL